MLPVMTSAPLQPASAVRQAKAMGGRGARKARPVRVTYAVAVIVSSWDSGGDSLYLDEPPFNCVTKRRSFPLGERHVNACVRCPGADTKTPNAARRSRLAGFERWRVR